MINVNKILNMIYKEFWNRTKTPEWTWLEN